MYMIDRKGLTQTNDFFHVLISAAVEFQEFGNLATTSTIFGFLYELIFVWVLESRGTGGKGILAHGLTAGPRVGTGSSACEGLPPPHTRAHPGAVAGRPGEGSCGIGKQPINLITTSGNLQTGW